NGDHAPPSSPSPVDAAFDPRDSNRPSGQPPPVARAHHDDVTRRETAAPMRVIEVET
ncbi:unnamed protein product, partial [Callosobruchus maculatus]